MTQKKYTINTPRHKTRRPLQDVKIQHKTKIINFEHLNIGDTIQLQTTQTTPRTYKLVQKYKVPQSQQTAYHLLEKNNTPKLYNIHIVANPRGRHGTIEQKHHQTRKHLNKFYGVKQ